MRKILRFYSFGFITINMHIYTVITMKSCLVSYDEEYSGFLAIIVLFNYNDRNSHGFFMSVSS